MFEEKRLRSTERFVQTTTIHSKRWNDLDNPSEMRIKRFFSREHCVQFELFACCFVFPYKTLYYQIRTSQLMSAEN